MRALLWTGYGVSDIYLMNDKNFDIVKQTVLSIMYSCYGDDATDKIEETEWWDELVSLVRELSYGDDNFESFELVNVQE